MSTSAEQDRVLEAGSHRRPTFSLRMLLGLTLFVCVLFAVLSPIWHYYTARRAEEARGLAESELRMEIASLDSAMQVYRLDVGAFPPAADPKAISKHVETFYKDGQPGFLKSNPNSDLSELEDDELLVIWLRDSSPSSYFAFEKARVIDADDDGWPEYVSRAGMPYRIVKGEVVAFCPETDVTVGSRDFEN